MPDRPSSEGNPWTIETLKVLIENRFTSERERTDAALAANHRAVEDARREIEFRLAGMNEFRNAMEDQAKRQVSQPEFDAKITAIVDRLTMHGSRLDKMEGRSVGLGVGWGFLLGAVALISTLVSIFLTLR